MIRNGWEVALGILKFTGRILIPVYNTYVIAYDIISAVNNTTEESYFVKDIINVWTLKCFTCKNTAGNCGCSEVGQKITFDNTLVECSHDLT